MHDFFVRLAIPTTKTIPKTKNRNCNVSGCDNARENRKAWGSTSWRLISWASK